MRNCKSLLVSGLLLALLSVPLAFAQNTLTSADNVDIDVVKSQLKLVESADVTSDESLARLVKTYRQIISLIEAKNSNQELAQQYIDTRNNSAAKLAELEDELARRKAKLPVKGPLSAPDAKAKEIELRLQKEKANMAAISSQLNSLEQAISRESARPAQISQELIEANKALDEANAQLRSETPKDISDELMKALRWKYQAQSAAAASEAQMLDQELISQSARVEMLELEKQIARAKLDYISQSLAIVEAELKDRQRAETDEIIDQLDSITVGDVAGEEIIRPYIDRNIELKDALQTITADLDDLRQHSAATTQTMRQVDTSYKIAKQRLEVAGMTQALGRVMHEQRRDLPDIRQLRKNAKQRSDQLSEAGLRDIRLNQEISDYSDPESLINDKLAGFPKLDTPELRELFTKVIKQGEILLKSTNSVNADYLRNLAELEFKQTQLLQLTIEADEFLKERLLWVRNSNPIRPGSLLVAASEFSDIFLSRKHWLEFGAALKQNLKSSFILPLAALMSIILVLGRRKLADKVSATGDLIGTREDAILSTFKGIGYTLLIAAPLPLILLALQVELLAAGAGAFPKAFGYAIAAVVDFVLLMRFVSVMCIPNGVAEKHFGWTPEINKGLRTGLRGLLIGFVLPAFVLVLDEFMDTSEMSNQLGRLMFMLAVISFCVFTVRLLRPDTGYIWAQIGRDGSEQRTWFATVMAVSIPATLMVAAAYGYLYAASTLMANLFSTLAIITLIAITHEVMERWLLILKRKLLQEQARSEQLAAYEAALTQLEGDDAPPVPEEPKIDIRSLDADTRKLVNTGLFILTVILLSTIWADVIVAFGFFREVTLWTYLDGLPGAEELVDVTLANFLFAIFLAGIIYVGAKTIPSLLDVILRTRTHVSSGARLAYSTLVRYAIVIIGLALISDEIGFQWSQVQWLVAALGVGIGFGLQEIVANFISGLIILVERPIRVGDVVTVGNVSGTVSKIQIRATTITNWDRQELLVPNREFIANQVLNWSLSDDILRLVLKVGVAYGSDVPKALKILNEVAQADSRVLKEPEPFCTFDEFGDSALLLTLRAFVGSPNKRFEIISDLNLEIQRRLAEADIVVAFPQRDLHLNTTEPLEIKLSKGSD